MIQGYLNADPEWTADEMLLGLAQENHDWADNNKSKLHKLMVALTLACVALIAQVGFWLVDLGTR